MKRKYIAMLATIVSVVIITVVLLSMNTTSQRSVIHAIEGSEVVSVRYNPDFGTIGSGDMKRIEDYDENELLSFLSTCIEKKTGVKSGGYSSDDVAIEILVSVDSEPGLKQILLGNVNVSSFGTNSRLYVIQNA